MPRSSLASRSTRILYVEDDEDIRELIADVLGGAGHRVTTAGSAEAALAALEHQRFDLLLTDYQLPGENAAWLIRAARDAGWVPAMPVLILTAEQRPAGVEGHRVLRKPLDLDALLTAIGEATRASAPKGARARPAIAAPAGLVLYVTGGSRHSATALRNLRRGLAGCDPGLVTIEIRDISRAGTDPALARALDEDRIIVTPTLVRVHPAPKIWIVGDLSAPGMIAELVGQPAARIRAKAAREPVSVETP